MTHTWFVKPTLDALPATFTNPMSSTLGIEFTEIGNDFLRGRMPGDERTRQPMGLLHGGASAALAETLGSVAGMFAQDPTESYVVGLAINLNHIPLVREGWGIGTARPFHMDRTTNVGESAMRMSRDSWFPLPA
jgi:uncharacterized protein (TIGR00369 family)